MLPLEKLKVFTGNAHPALAQEVCNYLEVSLGMVEVFKFSNDNTFVSIKENIREHDVFIIQPTCTPVNDNLMELLIMIDAAKRASAGRITAVMPYYGYGRTDKKDQPRVPITGRLVADLITKAGADRMLTIDLHAGQIQGFFNIPVDELSAMPTLTQYFEKKVNKDWVVVAVDIGISKRARNVAERLNLPLAIVEKRRLGNDDMTDTLTIIGDVKNKTALLFDDEIDTAGSLLAAEGSLRDRGAKDVYACCTHPIFSGSAAEVITNSNITEVVATDTVPVSDAKHSSKTTLLSIAPMLGEAIHRIYNGLSVGAMFEDR